MGYASFHETAAAPRDMKRDMGTAGRVETRAAGSPLRGLTREAEIHDPFASPRRLMRILRAIVQAFMLAMFDSKTHLRSRGSVGPELVRHHHARPCDGRF